jgi:hypothetical protein
MDENSNMMDTAQFISKSEIDPIGESSDEKSNMMAYVDSKDEKRRLIKFLIL